MKNQKRLEKHKINQQKQTQKIDQTEEFSSIPVNETTNPNAGTQNTCVKPKKKPRQKSQVQHSQEIQAKMKTQTQPSQVTQNTDNTQTNQGAINIQKQVVVNNFNCNNNSLSGQSKRQSTNILSGKGYCTSVDLCCVISPPSFGTGYICQGVGIVSQSQCGTFQS
ncbi:Hypothetical_protein [Hexamita inflata]|uniref:Hypothetical_protein n=1 Tax=Hexamita inflata TaxID=28002 RepID=A0ABP1KHJ1_9EUKA